MLRAQHGGKQGSQVSSAVCEIKCRGCALDPGPAVQISDSGRLPVKDAQDYRPRSHDEVVRNRLDLTPIRLNANHDL
jgi:hypothetical protein